jgi:hypothetical protein
VKLSHAQYRCLLHKTGKNYTNPGIVFELFDHDVPSNGTGTSYGFGRHTARTNTGHVNYSHKIARLKSSE